MRLDSAKNKILDIYYRDDIELRHKLLIILIIGIMIGDTVGMAFDFINGLNDHTLTIVMLIICAVSLVLCLKFKKYELAVNITVGSIALVVVPMMFFTEGGIHSGMICWMFIAVVITFLMLVGWGRYLVCSLVIAEYICCFFVEYFYPSSVTKLDEESKFIMDIISSFICTVVLMCALILIHLKSYERQKIKLEEQRQELIEKQKQLEDAVIRAQNADQAKSDFLANMSHEIRTPINAVLGMDEMILRETQEEGIREYATNIQSSGKALLSIINDILDFSKIEAGKMEICPDEYQLSSTLNDVKNMIFPRTNDKGLELRVECNPKMPSKLWGDEVRLRQIMVNLMTNAAKYTDAGSVTMNVDYKDIDTDNIMLEVRVEDTGKGIKEENIGYLFQTFKRIDLKSNRHIEGTGLGLALTRSLVELLNGTIGVDSVYGQGSVFHFEIPQKVIDHTEIGQLRHEAPAKESKYKASFKAPDAHILAVDDTVINLKVLAGLLKQTEIKIDQATSGKECLELVQENHYDLIFMDHMMPEMDGVETFTEMKKLGYYINYETPVIILTANAIQGVKEMYLEAGFTDYLSKPIKYEALEQMIIKYLPPEMVL